MTAESASDRQEQWVFVVRRSFGIPDLVAEHEAREAIVGSLEDQLRQNGWKSPARGIAEPMVDALMAMGASGDLYDRLIQGELALTAASFTGRDAAYQLIEMGMGIVDPETLIFDLMNDYPIEVVAAAQQALELVGQYVREQPFGG
ncbi:MAG: hypothetical protein ACRDYB_12275 [Acidimicrobiales bacterium]